MRVTRESRVRQFHVHSIGRPLRNFDDQLRVEINSSTSPGIRDQITSTLVRSTASRGEPAVVGNDWYGAHLCNIGEKSLQSLLATHQSAGEVCVFEGLGAIFPFNGHTDNAPTYDNNELVLRLSPTAETPRSDPVLDLWHRSSIGGMQPRTKFTPRITLSPTRQHKILPPEAPSVPGASRILDHYQQNLESIRRLCWDCPSSPGFPPWAIIPRSTPNFWPVR
ncbi:hypothetical protein BDM02DRAFT_1070052 [Thelephora ganbajun]|uniref:Uncharacterized protein n=1 Tax=Thelephora ganbajun TaxID=370292 RepID=A0ACB6ZW70_THEGA|nr:hypothetical protein BDM02DRAFT_1070052 [Thelephora ganbajun]